MLSQNPIQHGQNLCHLDPTPLYQADNKLDMFHCRAFNAAYAVFIEIRFRRSVLHAAKGIQMLLFYLAFRALIIFDAPVYGILPPVSLSAAKRTAKIAAACIAGVGEKQNLTMPASDQAFSQVRLFFENTANSPVIQRNNTANLFFAIPVESELKIRPYLYYKKAKCSLMSLMYLGIPSLSLFCLTIKLSTTGVLFL